MAAEIFHEGKRIGALEEGMILGGGTIDGQEVVIEGTNNGFVEVYSDGSRKEVTSNPLQIEAFDHGVVLVAIKQGQQGF